MVHSPYLGLKGRAGRRGVRGVGGPEREAAPCRCPQRGTDWGQCSPSVAFRGTGFSAGARTHRPSPVPGSEASSLLLPPSSPFPFISPRPLGGPCSCSAPEARVPAWAGCAEDPRLWGIHTSTVRRLPTASLLPAVFGPGAPGTTDGARGSEGSRGSQWGGDAGQASLALWASGEAGAPVLLCDLGNIPCLLWASVSSAIQQGDTCPGCTADSVDKA